MTSEAKKAEYAERQTTADPVLKCMLEFGIQDYHDKFNSILDECQKMPGVQTGDFQFAYMKIVANNISRFGCIPGAERLLIDILTAQFRTELIRAYKEPKT